MILFTFLSLVLKSEHILHCIKEELDGIIANQIIYKCSECETGYLINDKNCDQCDKENGYIQDTTASQFTCFKCPENCLECNPKSCTMCKEGYELKLGKCIEKCETVFPNCRTCDTTNDNKMICKECLLGYTLDKYNKCSRLPYKCREADKELKCLSCHYYYYVKNGFCYIFPEDIHCQIGSLVEGSKTKFDCEICETGYYLSNKDCIKCPKDCKDCEADGTSVKCSSCPPGYELDKDYNCVPCSKDPYCSLCIFEDPNELGSKQCQFCMSGYYMSTDTHLCTSCNHEKCKSCKYEYKEIICFDCEDGYYLDEETTECVPCPADAHCSKCSYNYTLAKPTCDSCIEGYYLSDTYKEPKCVSCPSNCLRCNKYLSSVICDICDPNTKPNHGRCEPIEMNYVTIDNRMTFRTYHLFAKNGDDYIEIRKRELYKIEQKGEFSINLYFTSYKCPQYTLLQTVESSYLSSYIKYIRDYDIPEICIDPKTDMVCINLSQVPSEYSFGYIPPRGDKIIDIENGFVEIVDKSSFSLPLYLTKSPYCEPNTFIKDIRTQEECYYFNISIVPLECRENISQIETPKPTKIPSPDNQEQLIIINATADEVTNANNNINDLLKQKFKLLNNQKKDPDVKYLEIVRMKIPNGKYTYDYNLELNDSQYIFIENSDLRFIYNGGNLNLYYENPSSRREYEVVLNKGNEINFSINGNMDIEFEFPKEYDQDDTKIRVNSKQYLSNNNYIYVPKSTNTISFESIYLLPKENKWGMLENEDKLNIWRNQNAKMNEETTKDQKELNIVIDEINFGVHSTKFLKNITINKAINVEQDSKIGLENVNFAKDAVINFTIHNYDSTSVSYISKLRKKQFPKIQINRLYDNNETVPRKYSLFQISDAVDSLSYDDFADKFDYGNTDFVDFEVEKMNLVNDYSNSYYIRLLSYHPYKPKKKDSNVGLIVGVVVAVVVVIAVVAVVVVIFVIKKKKMNTQSSEELDQQVS